MRVGEAKGGPPDGEGGAVVRRRAPPGPQAHLAQGLVPRGREAAGEGPPALRVDLPLRLRAPENRGGPLADPPHRHNAEVFSLALENFAREVGAGTRRRRILLVLDRAGWHTAKKLKAPEGIHLEFLPSHSPELQPSERLWPLSDEGVANRYYRAHGGPGGGAGGALRGLARSAGGHPLVYPLPLVAGGGIGSNAVQTDLVLSPRHKHQRAVKRKRCLFTGRGDARSPAAHRQRSWEYG